MDNSVSSNVTMDGNQHHYVNLAPMIKSKSISHINMEEEQKSVTSEESHYGSSSNNDNMDDRLSLEHYRDSMNFNFTHYNPGDISLPESSKSLQDYVIGHGATATVYKIMLRQVKNGYYDKQNCKAALKRFHTVGHSQDDLDKMLTREASLLNGLHHENIVRFLGVCHDLDYFGLLLELCEGGSLRYVYSKIDQNITLPLRVLIDWAHQIACGMEYLIGRGYIHRDLKSHNVLVKQNVCFCSDQINKMNFDVCSKCDGVALDRIQLKITDFGVTRKATIDDKRQSSVGTHAWLAPEAFTNNSYSEASDVWSFGVVLWELLSKEEPYKNEIPRLVAFFVALKGTQQLAIDENCPEKWKNIMKQCWELQPEKRPTFSQLVEYFREYAKDTQDTSVSCKLDSQLQRVQSILNQDIKSIYKNVSADNENELIKMFHQIYTPTHNSAQQSSDSRPRKWHKSKKPEISGPIGDVKHVASVQHEGAKKLKFIYNGEVPSTFETLPRSFGSKHAMSCSNPDLSRVHINNGASTISGSGGTMSRKNAVRNKHRGKLNPSSFNQLQLPSSHDFELARIESADDLDQHKEHKNGTFSRIKGMLMKNRRTDDEHVDRPSSIANRMSCSTSSARSPLSLGPTTRGPAAVGFLDEKTRRRAATSDFIETRLDVPTPPPLPRPAHKSSPKPRPVKPTNMTEIFVKTPDRPSQLPWPRKSDVSSSPETPAGRLTASSSAEYERLVASPPWKKLSHPVVPPMSSLSPTEPTHYQMSDGNIGRGHGGGTSSLNAAPHYLPVGGGCDNYLPRQMAHIADMNVVTNGIYQRSKPTSPPAANFAYETLSSSHGIGHGTNPLAQPPDIQAPPPPDSPPTRLAPVIPTTVAKLATIS